MATDLNCAPGLSRRSFMAASVALSAAPVSAQTTPLDLDVARREGRVVIYNNWQPSGIEALLAKFREAVPGIRTEHIRLGSNALIERFQTEWQAGRHLCDVLATLPDERLDQGLATGWMARWRPPEIAHFKPAYNEQDMLFTIQESRECIVWNKAQVRPADAPQEWADLWDSKWKGRVGLNPPWRSVAIQQIIAFWEDIGLKDAAERFKANEVRFFEGSGGIVQAVLRGDVRVAQLTDLPLNGLLEDGAPIGFVYPKSGTCISAYKAFVAAKAPNPNAARVFTNWLLSEQGQMQLQIHGGLSVTRNGMPPLSKLPATSALSNAVDGAKILTPERQKVIVDQWRTVFGIR